jgi:hypothetical protein
MKQLFYIVLAVLLSGSVCTPKPERSELSKSSNIGDTDESATPDGERAGSGYW